MGDTNGFIQRITKLIDEDLLGSCPSPEVTPNPSPSECEMDRFESNLGKKVNEMIENEQSKGNYFKQEYDKIVSNRGKSRRSKKNIGY